MTTISGNTHAGQVSRIEPAARLELEAEMKRLIDGGMTAVQAVRRIRQTNPRLLLACGTPAANLVKADPR